MCFVYYYLVLGEVMECNLCPRMCGADRRERKGFCGTGEIVYIARAAAHYGEEPCICGKKGSGAVFFSGCSLKCVFCQNEEISRTEKGRGFTVDELSALFLSLQSLGVHNINLVTPTHYAVQIASALKRSSLKIPVIYNTSGYESEKSLDYVNESVDVYLPDFKYFYRSSAEKFSNAPDYPEVAKNALRIMFKQVGNPVFECGMMKKGLLVRHLVLPGHTLESKRIIEWLYENFGNDIYISIMCQYTPMRAFVNFPELNRKVSSMEYREVVRFAERLGVVNAFVQGEESVGKNFIPDFSGKYFSVL